MSRWSRADAPLFLFALFLLAVPWGEVGAPAAPPYLSPTKLTFALFALAFLALRQPSERDLLRRADAWLALLLAGAALSVFASVLPRESLLALFRLLGMVALFLLARACLEDERGRRITVAALILAGTGQALLGTAQTLTARTFFGLGIYPPYQSLVPVESAADPDLALVYRAAGTFPHPNELGLFLVVTLAVTLATLAVARRGPGRWALAAAGLAQAIALLYTFSRSAWLGLLLAAGLLVLRGPSRRVIAAVLILAAVAGVWLLPPGGREALVSRGARLQPYEATRLQYFRAAARMARSHPLSGIGLGTYAERFDDFKDPGIEPDREQSSDAHNAFLAMAAEAGLPAGLALLCGFALSLGAVLRSLRRPGRPSVESLAPAAALLGTIPPLLLNGFHYQEVCWLALAWTQVRPSPFPAPIEERPPMAAGRRFLWISAAALALAAFVAVSRLGVMERTLSGKALLLETTPLGRRAGEHPRIYLDAAALGELRRATTTDPERFALLRKWSDDAERQTLAEAKDPDLRLLARTIPPFALARLLYRRPGDLDQVRRRIAALADRWAPGRLEDLEIAESVYACALAYDWLPDDLSARERESLGGIIREGAAALQNEVWRYPPLNNHRVVDAACLGIAGLACYGDLPGAGDWIRRGGRELELAARHFTDDGISPEGLGYATYVLEYLLKYYAAAEPLLDTPPVAVAWQKAFPTAFMHQALPPGRWRPDNLALSFGDSPRGAWYGPGYLAARLAARYNDPLARWIAAACRAKGTDPPESAAWLDPLWSGSAGPLTPPGQLPIWSHLANWGLYLARDSWDDDATLLGFACSPAGGRKLRRGGFAYPGLGHSQPEAASFVLFSRGEHLIAHPGPTTKKLTADHNTILVNGRGQLGEGEEWFLGRGLFYRSNTPDLIRAEHTERYDYVVGDASAAYDPRDLRRFVRHLMWLRPRVICLLDELAADRASSFEWLLHTEGTVEPLDERSVRITRGRASLLVRFLWPADVTLTWRTEDVAGASVPWGLSRWQTLRARPAGNRTETRFLVLLLPGDADDPPRFPVAHVSPSEAEVIVPGPQGETRIVLDARRADRPLTFTVRP